MWYFVAGAILGVAQYILRNPIQLMQLLQGGGHPIQATLTAAVLGAGVYGTILWLIGLFVF